MGALQIRLKNIYKLKITFLIFLIIPLRSSDQISNRTTRSPRSDVVLYTGWAKSSVITFSETNFSKQIKVFLKTKNTVS